MAQCNVVSHINNCRTARLNFEALFVESFVLTIFAVGAAVFESFQPYIRQNCVKKIVC